MSHQGVPHSSDSPSKFTVGAVCKLDFSERHFTGPLSQPLFHDDGTIDVNEAIDRLGDALPGLDDIERLYDDATELSDSAKEWWDGTNDEWNFVPQGLADYAKGWVDGGATQALSDVLDSDLIQKPLNDGSNAAGDAMEAQMGKPLGADLRAPLGLGYNPNTGRWYGSAGLVGVWDLHTWNFEGVCKEVNLQAGLGGKFNWAEVKGVSFDPTAYLSLNMKILDFDIGGSTLKLNASAKVDAFGEDQSVTGELTIDLGSLSENLWSN
tara:strand:- start:632 stop:1429 length:798 start_codon:yes stop_codon:yes gene_type:complete